MPDKNVKEALTLLCQFIRSLLDVELEPEDLIAAKNDSEDLQVDRRLRKTLSILSVYALRMREHVEYTSIGDYADKMNFTLLQYASFQFYTQLSERKTRVLLIAMAWLLATEDVLILAHRMKLCKKTRADRSIRVYRDIERRKPLPISDELNKLLRLNGKVNMNIKEIYELRREWSRLASEIGEASVEYYALDPAAYHNLPDLKACEIALTKRIALLDGKGSAEDRDKLRDFNDAQQLLELHAKWLVVRHVFFDWMVTVIKKHSESGPSKCVEANLRHFTSHLHRLIARRCRDLQESKETSSASKLQDFVFCPSFRLQKNQRPRPETPRRSSNNTTKNWDIREETLQGRSINAPALIRAHLDLYKEIMSYNAVLRPQLYTRNFPGYFTEYFPGDYETKRFISAFTRASPDFIDGKKQEGPSHVEL